MNESMLPRQIKRTEDTIAEYEAREGNLSKHGYEQLGYHKGRLSVMEDWMDCVNERGETELVKRGVWKECQKLYGVGTEFVCSVCDKGVRHYVGQPRCSECGAYLVEDGVSNGD